MPEFISLVGTEQGQTEGAGAKEVHCNQAQEKLRQYGEQRSKLTTSKLVLLMIRGNIYNILLGIEFYIQVCMDIANIGQLRLPF